MDFGLLLIIALNIVMALIGWLQYRDYREKRKFHIRSTKDRRKENPSSPYRTFRNLDDAFPGGQPH